MSFYRPDHARPLHFRSVLLAFLQHLDLNHKEILTSLRKGPYTDDIANTLESVAKEIAQGFEK